MPPQTVACHVPVCQCMYTQTPPPFISMQHNLCQELSKCVRAWMQPCVSMLLKGGMQFQCCSTGKKSFGSDGWHSAFFLSSRFPQASRWLCPDRPLQAEWALVGRSRQRMDNNNCTCRLSLLNAITTPPTLQSDNALKCYNCECAKPMTTLQMYVQVYRSVCQMQDD